MKLQTQTDKPQLETKALTKEDLRTSFYENPQSIIPMLLQDELGVLRVLFREERPMSTRAIVHENLIIIFEEITRAHSAALLIKMNETNKISPRQTELSEQKDKLSKTEYARRIYALLREQGIKTASHGRVETILESFKAIGIVKERTDVKGKTNKLWFIDPNFLNIWHKNRDEIIELLKKDKEMLHKKYSGSTAYRIIQFYDLTDLTKSLLSNISK